MKRILILNWWDSKNPKAGGAEVYLKEVFSRIADKKEYQITLFCSRFSGSRPIEKLNSIRVIRRGPYWLINLTSILWYLKHKNQFDLVVDFTNKIPYLTPLFVRKPHLAIALHLFGPIWSVETKIGGQMLAKLEQWLFRRYKRSHFITISQSTRKDLASLGIEKEKIKVVYPGISSLYFPANPKTFHPSIVYLGRLKKYKRIDLLLEVFGEILLRIPEAKLVIIGQGNDEKRLKKISQNLRIDHQVSFLGFLKDSQKINWLQKAWVNVQPSIKEGWGLTVIEAAACGTPTIAANAPGLRESVIDGKTGWLFKTKKELENLLIEILKNHQKRKKAGQEALAFSKRFSWDKTAEEVEEVISSLIANESPSKRLR